VRKFFPFKGRQDYILTKVDPETLYADEFAMKLITIGYQFNYFSFEDKDEIMNLRKLYISPHHQIRQFHVRLYSNGEIRAHDELSYEEDAVGHVNSVTMGQIPIAEKDNIIQVIENDTI
jgi:hypothetical protein